MNVVSEHTPLDCILKKALANTCLQGMMMRLQKYDVDQMYVPGKNPQLADTLSRVYRPTIEGLHKDFEHVHVVGHVPISKCRLEAIRTAAEADQVMTALKQTILKGWPEERAHLPPTGAPLLRNERRTRSIRRNRFPGRMHWCTSQPARGGS